MTDRLNKHLELLDAIDSITTDPMVKMLESVSATQMALADPMKNLVSQLDAIQQSMIEPMKEVRQVILTMRPKIDEMIDMKRLLENSIQVSISEIMTEFNESLMISQSSINSVGYNVKDYQFNRLETVEKGLENVDSDIDQFVSGLSSVQTMEMYQDVSEVVKGNDILPDELAESVPIKVYSTEKLKNRSHKIIFVIFIVLMSSGLTWEEIEKVIQNIGCVMGIYASVKSLKEDK